MVLVDVLLAFALVMLGLATVVTVMVEITHRILRLRARGMQQILERSCKNILLPRIKSSIDGRTLMRQFAQQMMSNPLLLEEDKEIRHQQMGETVNTRMTKAAQQVKLKLRRLELGSRIKWLGRCEDMDVVQCLQQLQSTELYQQLKQDVQEEFKDTLESFADSYEHYCAAISVYFKRRAQLLSLVLGILLAFLANIDGLRIFNAFVQDPELTDEVIALQGELETAYRQAAEQLEQAQSDELQAADLQARADTAITRTMALKNMGLPFGWTYFPGCGGEARKTLDVLCRSDLLSVEDWSGEGFWAWFIASEIYAYIAWTFKVLITGLMIGLGGPFWFDVAQRLASIRRGMSRRSEADRKARTREEQIADMSSRA